MCMYFNWFQTSFKIYYSNCVSITPTVEVLSFSNKLFKLLSEQWKPTKPKEDWDGKPGNKINYFKMPFHKGYIVWYCFSFLCPSRNIFHVVRQLSNEKNSKS